MGLEPGAVGALGLWYSLVTTKGDRWRYLTDPERSGSTGRPTRMPKVCGCLIGSHPLLKPGSDLYGLSEHCAQSLSVAAASDSAVACLLWSISNSRSQLLLYSCTCPCPRFLPCSCSMPNPCLVSAPALTFHSWTLATSSQFQPRLIFWLPTPTRFLILSLALTLG